MAADRLGIGGWPCPAWLSTLGTPLFCFSTTAVEFWRLRIAGTSCLSARCRQRSASLAMQQSSFYHLFWPTAWLCTVVVVEQAIHKFDYVQFRLPTFCCSVDHEGESSAPMNNAIDRLVRRIRALMPLRELSCCTPREEGKSFVCIVNHVWPKEATVVVPRIGV